DRRQFVEQSRRRSMSDQLHQAKAVRVQSSAIVAAAVITTCGAVASALIQTGGSAKPSVGRFASFAANANAAVISPFDCAAVPTFGTVERAAANSPASLTRATDFTQAEAVETQAQSQRQTVHTNWTVAKPELEATQSPKPIVSPWYYLSHPNG